LSCESAVTAVISGRFTIDFEFHGTLLESSCSQIENLTISFY
jgi:hypothetical protein